MRDLRLLNAQATAIIKKLEEESFEKSRKLMKLQSAEHKAQVIVGLPRPKIELSSLAKKGRAAEARLPPPPSQNEINLVGMYEALNKQLEEEIKYLKQKLVEAQSNVDRVARDLVEERELYLKDNQEVKKRYLIY